MTRVRPSPFPSASVKTPALDAWRRELRAGERTRETFDWLWRAACAESAALEFQRIPELAYSYRRDAQRIVRDAARQQMATR